MLTRIGEAIMGRRSVRAFTGEAIPRCMIEDILNHALQAPSPKNSQPWLLRVLGRNQCRELCTLASACLDGQMTLDEVPQDELAMARITAATMGSAAAACFVVLDADYRDRNASSQMWGMGATDCEVADLLSLGMLAQNALLRAHELDIGSLCICDHFCFYEVVSDYLVEQRPIVLGLLFGVARKSTAIGDQSTRKPLDEISEWNWGLES